MSYEIFEPKGEYMATIVQARVAKKKLKSMLAPSLHAVFGLSGSPPDSYSVEVRLPKAAAPGQIPKRIDGVPINVVVVGTISAAKDE